MNTPTIDWSGYIVVVGIIAGGLFVYRLLQVRESTILTWILGLVILAVLCASMFGTDWFKLISL